MIGLIVTVTVDRPLGSCTGWYDFYAGRDCGINTFPRTVF